MNITIDNIKYRSVTLLLVILTLLVYSCTNENEVGARMYEGERIPLSINMGTHNTTNSDEAISSVRAIVFNDKDQLVYNEVTNASVNDDNTHTAKIRAARGYNNIYIICNETPELTEKLAAITLENEIENVTFSAVGIVAPPPMYGNVMHAYVESRSDGTNATVIIDNIRMTELPIKVTRMVSRISFTAIKNISNEDEDFKVTQLAVKVCRMPSGTPIGEGQTYTGNDWSDDLTIPGTGELDNNGTYSTDGNYSIPTNVDCITIPDTYIPENLLSEPADASKATYLKIDAQCVLKNGSTQVLNCIYLLKIGQKPPKNHNLTRNNHYRIYATIIGLGAMGLYAEIVAMEEHDITINWKPIDGLVIVSDKAADYDAVVDTSRNVNIWNDFSVYSGVLKAYHSETGYKDILFKYGSLIAISSPDAGTGFTPPDVSGTLMNDVLWCPGSYIPSSITKWADIPYLETDKIPADNTAEQVATGQGDPCKLAGLSESQIKTLGIVDNKQWHMATPAENQILIAATDNETSSSGYSSFHWLFSPHNRYRDTNGVSQGDRSNGWYWDNNATVFNFSGKDSQHAEIQENMNRQNAYMIRCVRNEIPASRLEVGIISSPTYQGTKTGVNAYFGIKSNIPYWTATLVTSGADAGSTNEFDDFSFAAGDNVIHTTHGSNTQNIPVYVKRKESTSSRSFRVKVEGIGLDGEKKSTLLTVSQSGYTLRAKTELSNIGNIPQERNSYTTTINLTPTDITLPAGKLFLQVSYGDALRSESTKVDIEPDKYNYNVNVTIHENTSPSAINLTVNIFLDYEKGLTILLGSSTIMQDGTLSNN